jgi:hypothetical protein
MANAMEFEPNELVYGSDNPRANWRLPHTAKVFEYRMVRLPPALNHASELFSLVIVLICVVLRARGGLLIPCQMLVAF